MSTHQTRTELARAEAAKLLDAAAEHLRKGHHRAGPRAIGDAIAVLGGAHILVPWREDLGALLTTPTPEVCEEIAADIRKFDGTGTDR